MTQHPTRKPSVAELGMHRYLSTACIHNEHEKCRRECKYCAMPCVCGCHQQETEQ